ncbi:AAA family ATPase [Candidatus Daviesbacteria bacterium]|nr:AAA family ATPase [Candidatus Daviesbacteria bacterium]
MEKKSNPEIILGFVGKLGAGKGEAISYLIKKYDFYSTSLSDRIREEIKRRGQEITRETLQKIGGEMRQSLGPSVLAKLTLENVLVSGAKFAVIDSIRALEEAQFLKTAPNFHLVAVDADPKIRFQRLVKRARENDPITWEGFLKTEKRDNVGDGRNIDACIALADFKINNRGTQQELYSQLDKLLKKLDLPT